MWLLKRDGYGDGDGDDGNGYGDGCEYGNNMDYDYGDGDEWGTGFGNGCGNFTKGRSSGNGYCNKGPDPDHLLLLAALQGGHCVVT